MDSEEDLVRDDFVLLCRTFADRSLTCSNLSYLDVFEDSLVSEQVKSKALEFIKRDLSVISRIPKGMVLKSLGCVFNNLEDFVHSNKLSKLSMKFRTINKKEDSLFLNESTTLAELSKIFNYSVLVKLEGDIVTKAFFNGSEIESGKSINSYLRMIKDAETDSKIEYSKIKNLDIYSLRNEEKISEFLSVSDFKSNLLFNAGSSLMSNFNIKTANLVIDLLKKQNFEFNGIGRSFEKISTPEDLDAFFLITYCLSKLKVMRCENIDPREFNLSFQDSVLLNCHPKIIRTMIKGANTPEEVASFFVDDLTENDLYENESFSSDVVNIEGYKQVKDALKMKLLFKEASLNKNQIKTKRSIV